MPTSQSLENSGSLTGHILAQGWSDTSYERNTAKVVIALLAALGLLVVIGLLVMFVAGDILDTF